MHMTSAWKYVNKGLLAILAIFVTATVASIIFLTYTLLALDNLITKSGKSVSTAFVLQDLFINLQEAESGIRGYIITEDPSYLKPYNDAIKRLPENIETLRSNQRLDITAAETRRIEDLVGARLITMDQVLKSYVPGNKANAQELVEAGRGQELTTAIRKEVTTVSTRSLQSIGPMQRDSQANLQRSLWVAAVLSLFVLATSAVLIWYFQRTILRERALESTKNEFLSLASHQLRTPATNVKQYIGLLLDGYMGEMTQEQRHALRIAYKNNESEINIMNDLLDVAKLDLKRIQLQKEPTDIVALAKQVITDYSKITTKNRQTIDFAGPGELMADVDADYIKGVIENLIDNAVKYSKPDTKIKVTVKSERGMFVVSVRDHGLGMGKKDVSKLFTKFTRLANEFSANTEGSGLGLYWVKQIMELHNGGVEVVSRVGKGTIFTVYAPLR